jgi:hypothetical protein
MDISILTTSLILTIGQTLGVGASTFALIFYIMATQDGVIDASERRFMGAVYVVLRVGMVLIALALVGRLFVGIPLDSVGNMQWLLLGIITLNAVLMSMRKMPMRFGPVLAGGSWYSFFLVSTLPLSLMSLWILGLLYVAFLSLFFIAFTVLRNVFKGKNS